MRLIVLLAFVSISLISCSKYQYLTISAADKAEKTKEGFVAENNTVKITYQFSGFNGPVLLSVYNKSAVGIQVDWSKSFIITGESARPIYSPESQVRGEIRVDRLISDVKTLAASIIPQPALEFIPPQTSLSRNSFTLINKSHFPLDTLKLQKETIEATGFLKKIRRARFNNNNTPFSFRVYLTIVPEGKTAESMVFDRSFYVSELIASKADEDELNAALPGEQRVILTKTTAAGTFLGLVGLVAAGTAIAVIAIAE